MTSRKAIPRLVVWIICVIHNSMSGFKGTATHVTILVNS